MHIYTHIIIPLYVFQGSVKMCGDPTYVLQGSDNVLNLLKDSNETDNKFMVRKYSRGAEMEHDSTLTR